MRRPMRSLRFNGLFLSRIFLPRIPLEKPTATKSQASLHNRLRSVPSGGARIASAPPKSSPCISCANRMTSPPAPMAVEDVLAAIDIKRRPAVGMQRARSAHLVRLAVSGRLPTLLFEVSKQRNPPPHVVA